MPNRIELAAAAMVLMGSAMMSEALLADEPTDRRTTTFTIRLWPGDAPGAKGAESADIPTLTAYLPPKGQANGAAVVICPGGAYLGLAKHEGRPVAEWLHRHGVAAFVLKYRLAPRYRHPAPMLDAQRAVRTVRARAAEWNIDPNRIGILGFSAGGHLASTVGTHFDAGKPDATDPIDRVSCRPDFVVLIYPVITLTSEFTHRGSRRALLGDDPPPELLRSLSNETQVTGQTPPTFLVHTAEDRAVPCENSILFAMALHRHRVPMELHIFEKGRHGFGLGGDDPVLRRWPELCIAWMKARGFISAARSGR